MLCVRRAASPRWELQPGATRVLGGTRPSGTGTPLLRRGGPSPATPTQQVRAEARERAFLTHSQEEPRRRPVPCSDICSSSTLPFTKGETKAPRRDHSWHEATHVRRLIAGPGAGSSRRPAEHCRGARRPRRARSPCPGSNTTPWRSRLRPSRLQACALLSSNNRASEGCDMSSMSRCLRWTQEPASQSCRVKRFLPSYDKTG